jgi:hypothetical protein
MSTDDEIAAHLQAYEALFQEQTALGLPLFLEFPAPQCNAARAALHLTIAKIEKKIGMWPIRFTT